MKESKFFEEVKEFGREEGREEGQVEASRRHVLSLAQRRFGTAVTRRITPSVNAIEDLTRLEELLLSAATCASAADLEQELAR